MQCFKNCIKIVCGGSIRACIYTGYCDNAFAAIAILAVTATSTSRARALVMVVAIATAMHTKFHRHGYYDTGVGDGWDHHDGDRYGISNCGKVAMFGVMCKYLSGGLG